MPQGEILYSSNREGASNLWAIPSDGGTPVQITRGPGPDLGIKASKDGKRVLYMQASTFGAVMLGAPDGANARQVTPDDMTVVGPAFSPDGKQIAYVVKDPDPIKSLAFLYIVDRDGQNRRRLTTAPENIENFVWSPDGRKIAYALHVDIEADSAHKIAIIDVADPTQKSIRGNGRVVQWLSDGSSLNVLSKATCWRMTLSDGKMVPMHEDSTLALESPDGQKLMILDNHLGTAGLSVKNGDKPLMRLVDGPVDGGTNLFEWLPDGKRFVYTKGGVIWVVSVDSGERSLYPWKRSDAVAFTDISRDGKEALFVKERMNGKLILIDNFH
jgi:Tol biopolymer transport system component